MQPGGTKISVNSATGRRWRKRALEIAFWVLTIGFFWTVDVFTKLTDRQRTGIGLDDFRLFTQQATSAVAAMLMVYFVLYWCRQFPLLKNRLLPVIVGHLVGSVIFAVGHYALFVLFRLFVFRLNDMDYVFVRFNHIDNLVLEWQKDIKIYVAMVAIITVYRRFFGADERPSSSPSPQLSDRLMVQTGNGETIVRFDQIDYLEAARNYVVVHADEQEYLVRDTLGNLEKKLTGGHFARTHRSFIINLDRIAEIRPTDVGKHLIRLAGGAEVPLSRGYRNRFKSQLSP